MILTGRALGALSREDMLRVVVSCWENGAAKTDSPSVVVVGIIEASIQSETQWDEQPLLHEIAFETLDGVIDVVHVRTLDDPLDYVSEGACDVYLHFTLEIPD